MTLVPLELAKVAKPTETQIFDTFIVSPTPKGFLHETEVYRILRMQVLNGLAVFFTFHVLAC